jgi:hypothetical protein
LGVGLLARASSGAGDGVAGEGEEEEGEPASCWHRCLQVTVRVRVRLWGRVWMSVRGSGRVRVRGWG